MLLSLWILLYCCQAWHHGDAAQRYKNAERHQAWSPGADTDEQPADPSAGPSSHNSEDLEHSTEHVEHNTANMEHNAQHVEDNTAHVDHNTTPHTERNTAHLEHSTAHVEHNTTPHTERNTAHLEHSTAHVEHKAAPHIELNTSYIVHNIAPHVERNTAHVQRSTASERQSMFHISSGPASLRRKRRQTHGRHDKERSSKVHKVIGKGSASVWRTRRQEQSGQPNKATAAATELRQSTDHTGPSLRPEAIPRRTRRGDEPGPLYLTAFGISSYVTKRVETTLLGRTSPFSAEDKARRPVTAESCTCQRCNTTRGAYTTDEYENVLYNKPVKASSFKDNTHPPCAANNGILSSSNNHDPVSYISGDGDEIGWLIIDMEYVYTFDHFIIRRWHASDGSGGRERLLGVNVLADSRIIYAFPRYTNENGVANLPTRLKIDLSTPETARFITLQKRDDNVQRTERNYVLSVINLEIWVCKMNTYGSYGGGCQPCPAVCDTVCDNYHGCPDEPITYNFAVFKKTLRKMWGYLSYQRGSPDNVVNARLTTSSDDSCYVYKATCQAAVVFFLDLGAAYRVASVVITSRTFCCHACPVCKGPDYLKETYVLVIPSMDENYLVLDGQDDRGYLCYYQREGVPTKTRVEFTCIENKVGRVITLQTYTELGLCEIEAYGNRVYEIPFESPCEVGSVTQLCAIDTFCDNGFCKKGLGIACDEESDCLAALVCDLDKCKADVGGKCETDETCASELVCTDNVCRSELGLPGKCKPWRTNECPANSRCDILRRCVKAVGEGCGTSFVCTAGSKCLHGVCTCNTAFSVQDGEKCTPKAGLIGSACRSNDDCTVGSCQYRECACGDGQVNSFEDFSCKLDAEASCENNYDCGYGLVCEGRKCHIVSGGNCKGSEEFCRDGNTCHDDKCRLETGQPCTNNEELCLPGTTCIEGHCKIDLGQDCQDFPQHCASGHCSSDNNTCRIPKGESCTSDTGEYCEEGSFCEDDEVCKTDIGGSCSSDEDCGEDIVCTTREGSQDQKCRRPMGGTGCDQDEDCAANTVCDAVHACHIPIQGNCEEAGSVCVAGGECFHGQCRCVEGSVAADDGTCVLGPGKLGGACRPPGDNRPPCEDPWALCQQDRKCHCADNFVLELSACRTTPGGICKVDSNCTKQAFCEGGVCVLKFGESCEGEQAAWCSKNSLCDVDHVCRLNIHQPCVNETECRQNTTCDALKKCKRGHSDKCRQDSDCMAGSFCSRSQSSVGVCQCTEGISTFIQDTCVPNEGLVGGACQQGGGGGCKDGSAVCNADTGLCQCKKGFAGEPARLTCGKIVGEPCTKDDKCSVGLICDSVVNECRVGVGEMCEPKCKDCCATDYICDLDHLCRLELKGDCSGEKEALCKIGTFCDFLHQCNIAQGDSCTAAEGEEDPCVAGAKCVDHVCLCQSGVSTAYGALCEPDKGLYGGQCQLACTTENSICVDSQCECSTGFKPTREFRCVSKWNLDPQVPAGWLLSAIIAASLLLLCYLCCACFLYLRRRRKSKETKEEAEKRIQSLKKLEELKAQTHELKELGEPGQQQGEHGAEHAEEEGSSLMTVPEDRTEASASETTAATRTSSLAYTEHEAQSNTGSEVATGGLSDASGSSEHHEVTRKESTV